MQDFNLISDNTNLLKKILKEIPKESLKKMMIERINKLLTEQIEVNEIELANHERWIDKMAEEYKHGGDYEGKK